MMQADSFNIVLSEPFFLQLVAPFTLTNYCFSKDTSFTDSTLNTFPRKIVCQLCLVVNIAIFCKMVNQFAKVCHMLIRWFWNWINGI